MDDDVADVRKVHRRLQHGPSKEESCRVLRKGMQLGTQRPGLPKFQIAPNRSRLAQGVGPLKLNQLSEPWTLKTSLGWARGDRAR